jgi:arylsulfatase A-like enzyme
MKKLPIALFAIPGLGISTLYAPAGNAVRPNIIVIVTDDHRFDALGAMRNRIIRTPNLDALAHNGILFTNAYVTSSVSCCSRASILTGQYVSRHGINDFDAEIPPEAYENTYPMQLKSSGYKVGFIGKYGNGLENQPKDKYDYWACEKKYQPDYENKDIYGNFEHHTDLVSRQIAQFLDNFGNRTEPFCLSVSFKAPHIQDNDQRQFIPHERYSRYYEDVTIPVPLTAGNKYWEMFPLSFREKSEARKRWNLEFNTPDNYQKSVKNYYRLITQVDDVVGDMLNQLRRLGIEKNTIILFMGDNGFFLGEHGLSGKWFIYEESIRIPLLLYNPSLPKVERGTIVSRIALNIDVAPTILALAGLKAPACMQGKNLIEALKSGNPWRTDFYYEHRLASGGTIPESEGVVSLEYKYVSYYKANPPYEEFFDLKKDPHEIQNKISDPGYLALVLQYRNRCGVLRASAK